MKTIVLALVALLILGGGGAGAYVFLFQSPAEAAVDEIVDAKPAKEEKKPGEYVELQPLILPIIDEYGVNQVVSLVVTIEVADKKGVDKVTKFKPRLTDAFLQDLYGTLNRHAAIKGGLIRVDVLKKRLNKVSTKVVGDEVIQDVLLQVVQQRPI